MLTSRRYVCLVNACVQIRLKLTFFLNRFLLFSAAKKAKFSYQYWVAGSFVILNFVFIWFTSHALWWLMTAQTFRNNCSVGKVLFKMKKVNAESFLCNAFWHIFFRIGISSLTSVRIQSRATIFLHFSETLSLAYQSNCFISPKRSLSSSSSSASISFDRDAYNQADRCEPNGRERRTCALRTLYEQVAVFSCSLFARVHIDICVTHVAPSEKINKH